MDIVGLDLDLWRSTVSMLVVVLYGFLFPVHLPYPTKVVVHAVRKHRRINMCALFSSLNN